MERITKYSKIEQGAVSRIFFVVNGKEVEYKLALVKQASLGDYFNRGVVDGYAWYLCYASPDGKTAISGVYSGGYTGCGTSDFDRSGLVDLAAARYEFVTNDLSEILEKVEVIANSLCEELQRQQDELRERRSAYVNNFGEKTLYSENGFTVAVEFSSNFLSRPDFSLVISTHALVGYLAMRDWFTSDGKFLRSKATKIFGENAEAMLRAVKDKSDKIRREVNVLRY